MPQVNQAIGNTYDTITRPVAIGVAKDCLKQMGFNENAYLSFLGFGENGLNKTNSFEEINKNFFGTDTTAEITFREQPRQGMMYTTSVFRPDQLCFFRDEKSNLYLRPVKQPSEIEITFKLRFESLPEANRWRDDIYARSTLLRHKNYHRVTYSYPIPVIYMNFLWDMHTLIKKSDPEEEQDFADYFFKYADKRAATLTNHAYIEHMPVIPETQVRVLGWYNFEEIVDEPTHDKEKGTWEVEWSYTFLYDKVIECVLYHELVVRQNVIQDHWLPEDNPYNVDGLSQETDLAGSNSNELAEHHLPDFETRSDILVNRQPVGDTWYPLQALQHDLRDYKPSFIVLTTLLPDDSRLVVNLNELGDFEIHPSVMALIKKDRKYVTDHNESVINVSIFGDECVAFPRQQFLDEELNLKATGDLSRQPVYRVVISVLKDLSKLSEEAQDRAKDNGCLLYDVFKEMWPAAAKVGLIPRPNGRCEWTNEQWEYIKDLLSPPKPGKPWQWGWPPRVPGLELDPGYNPGGGKPPLTDLNMMSVFRTVGIFTIVARRPKHASS